MLVYLCPALMDWLIFFVLTAVMYVAGERGVGFGGCSIFYNNAFRFIGLPLA